MRYDISKQKAPEMPNLGKGTEIVKLLLSQASEIMHEPLVPMLFPSLGAHISGAEFQYPDNSWKEPTGIMANLVAKSGDNKGQLSCLVKAICRDFRQHDKAEEDKYREWQHLNKTEPNNKKKTAEPTLAYWFPPTDTTKPAFLKNAIALEAQGGRTQYFNLPEVEMADQLCGNHKQVSLMIRNIYDRARAGALRATADGITGNPILRACITISSNPDSTRKFYKYELTNGTFGRMVFSFKPRGKREGRIPRLGKFPDEFYQQLDDYLARLDLCKGRYIIRPLNKLIDRLAADMATLADLTDDDVLFEISHRSLISAWKAGCILWVLNGQTWTKSMGDLVEWLVYHDLWSKMQIFGDLLGEDGVTMSEAQRRGPKNMLDKLPDAFNEAQLQAVRVEAGKAPEGAKEQLRNWTNRKFITFNELTGLYTKTEEYLKVKSEIMDKVELQKLRELPIEAVAERLGLQVTRHKCLCPFHDDHHASMSFKVSKNTCRCFVCMTQSIGPIDLVMKYLNKDFKEACQWLETLPFAPPCMEGNGYNQGQSQSTPRESQFDASRYEKYFEHPWLLPEARKFLFEERKLDERVVRWCRLTSWKDKQGVPWLQIPYYDREGKLVGVQNRNLVKGGLPRFRFPQGSECGIYNLPVLNMLKPGEPLFITEGCSDCWAMLSAGHKAIAIPSATLLTRKDMKSLSTLNSKLSTDFRMYPDNDAPGERLFLQLQKVLPSLVHHQLSPDCKDFSEYYLKKLAV